MNKQQTAAVGAAGRVTPRADFICPLCGGTRARALRFGRSALRWPADWGLVRCSACGLTLRCPQPDAAAIAAMYDHEYYDAHTTVQGGREELSPYLLRRLDRIEARRPQRGRLLEIGPGFGLFLDEARRRGWDVQGVEISEWAAEDIRGRLGVPVVTGTLEQAHLPDAAFDVAHMNHVLEHLPDPVGTVGELRRVLKPGGLIALEVPQELVTIYEPIARLRGRLGGRPLPEATTIPSPHLFFYRPATLRALLTRCGFPHVETRVYRPAAFSTRSRFPGGAQALRAIYWAERVANRAPLLEAFAT